MKRISLAITTALLLAGCGEAPTPRETDLVEQEAPAPQYAPLKITVKELNEPLTEAEVASFVDLMKSLPGGKPPEFSPVTTGAKVQGLHLDQAMQSWRGAVRNALTVKTLMTGWNPRSQARQILGERKVSGPALASLMLRMSCTVGMEALGGRRQVAAQRVITDEKIQSIIMVIQRMHKSGETIADSYWQGLEEAVSLSEYLNILLELPESNQAVIAAYRDDLKSILPDQSKMTTPQEKRENSQIVPVRFDDLAPAKPQPKRSKARQSPR